ncbi:MAG: c-type cytochrome, partial [Verrucomicrobia bacterium]|nr:c-type cytochrome [Verrucomicrobiota bacterium]
MSKRLIILFFCFAALSRSFAQDNALPPGTMLLPETALPDYEASIDHHMFIRDDADEVIQQGREIYQQICHTCHGDINLPGSIPNSLRFGEGEFQHGSDPYTMYQTITRGWRLMAPQTQLVPEEKYSVIHYIRYHFLKYYNPDQYFEVTESYLADLPKGSEMGSDPVKREPWREMDYGPFLTGTFEIVPEESKRYRWPEGDDTRGYVAPGANIAYKAIAIRLDPGEGGISQGNTWLAFEHDTMRVAGVWKGEGFVDWQGINFDSQHWYWPRTSGRIIYETEDVPGWANPSTGKFTDERFVGLDGRRFGPLPKDWMHFEGLYRHENRIVISYSVGKTDVLESHVLTEGGNILRILNVGKSAKDLNLRLANHGTPIGVQGSNAVTVRDSGGFVVATIPAEATPLNLAFVWGDSKSDILLSQLDLKRFTSGGLSQWPEAIPSPIIRGNQKGPFQWDSFALPKANPWKSWLRVTGVEFAPDGRSAILCTWDGDVWKVNGITDEEATTASWKRIASGLFQPLGVKIVKGELFVTCRDQLVRLHDLNGDGEMDFYENFNSDHQVTEHFHEFAMGLQVDAEGNFYYAKSGRHARPPLVAHHGTLLKVSPDGSTTEIIAKGFRAANGVCINPDGSFIVTDQEGYWNPMNRINWVTPGNRFFGNMWSYGAPEDSSDSAMEQPLAWVDKAFDRSPAELLWIDSESWGPLNGKLLNLSYGHGRLEMVPHEFVNGQPQGGLCRLPIPDFPTGIIRGRFHPGNGHLYLCGMSAWATNQMDQPGGFYRVRATGKPSHMPIALKAKEGRIEITFSDPL